MLFSFKKINIEAPFPTTQCGHSCQTFEVNEYKDHLYCRATSFKDDKTWIIHLSFDLLACTVDTRTKLRDSIREKLGNKDIIVITSTTHTHYGNSVRTDKYLEFLVPVVVQGVSEMVYEEVGDVETSYQRVYCPLIGKSRITGYETNNEFLVLIRFYAGGKTILSWISNNTHPTTLRATSPFFSAEYPGYVLKLLEEKYGGNFTIAMGPMGDISTRFTRSGQEYENMVELAEKLEKEVEKLINETPVRKPLTLNYHEVEMNYEHDFTPIEMSQLPDNLTEREIETIKIGASMREKLLETKTFLGMPLGAQVLASWDIGAVKLIFFPNEMFSEYLNELDLNTTYLFSYSNGYGPYVLPVDFSHVTYEMFIDTTSKKTKQMIKEMIRTI